MKLNKKTGFAALKRELVKKTLNPFSMSGEPPPYTIIIPILLYIAASVIVAAAANSKNVIMIRNIELPVSAFAGVLSTLANLCVISMVVLYKKRGYITSLILLMGQMPTYIMSLIARNNLASVPGLFMTALTIIAITIIYVNNVRIEGKQESLERLFRQTATSLVSAIDAKDTYTHGHSSRVAEYSRKIAELVGKSESECSEIYYAALLHDVGKIGVPESIINKHGKLTSEEFEIIKQHPAMGAQILQSIREYPFLSIGAHYHHERYDGKGYPDGLKGTDIPEIARIVSIADAYDAMTSKRSYREPLPQQKVREEFVKGIGTQFDPDLARLMVHLIDLDTEYEMKESEEVRELSGRNEMNVEGYRSNVSNGILITPNMTTIRMKVSSEKASVPSLILFDSLDGRVHSDEKDIKDMFYFEYGEIWFDGKTECRGARKMETRASGKATAPKKGVREYTIDAVRFRDHVLVRLESGGNTAEIITALPDFTRYCYIGITGEHCRLSRVSIDKADFPVAEDYIPRIAEEVSFIDGPVGDIPNVQVDTHRSASSEGIEIRDGLKLTCHVKSLPTARLVWHCPYIDIFTADDGKVNGKGYHDRAFARFDGECWACDETCDTRLSVNMDDSFEGWEEWKRALRKGYDTSISFSVNDGIIVITTENGGISIKNTVRIKDENAKVYAALTGDQCAITNIRIQ